MLDLQRRTVLRAATMAAAIAVLATGCSSMGMGGGHDAALHLSGAQEVPPNQSNASGSSTIKVADDKTITGGVTYSGMTATAAHIHEGAKGANGPVIVPLVKTSDTAFGVAPGAKLSDAQFASYKAGN